MTVQPEASVYPARLEIDYPDQHDRTTTFFRAFMIIPIAIVITVLEAGVTQTVYDRSGQVVRHTSGGIAVGLFAARDLNRWLPLVKLLLAIPHFIVLFFLYVAAFFSVVIAWFAILFTGQYPRGLFDFVVGVSRWGLRVQAYAFLLVTDRYPPFSLT